MACLSTDECAAAYHGLVFGWSFIPGFGLFDSDIAKLCRIKYLSAALALNKFGIVLTGDDFDDGMFALWGHEWRERMVWILPVSRRLVKTPFRDFQ